MRGLSRITWEDITKIIELKTFYLILLQTLLGITLLSLSIGIFRNSDSVGEIMESIGITLITSGSVSFVYEVYLRLDIESYASLRIVRELSSIIPLKESFLKMGLQDAGINRGELNMRDIVKNAKGFLKIMGLSVPDITDEGCREILVDRLKEEPSFIVQILIINPFGLISHKRSRHLAYRDSLVYYQKLITSITELKLFTERFKEDKRIDVRIYSDIPFSSIIITDEYAVVTLYTSVRTGATSPYLIFKKIEDEGSVYSIILTHFENIWKKGISIKGKDMRSLLAKLEEFERKEENKAKKMTDKIRKIFEVTP